MPKPCTPPQASRTYPPVPSENITTLRAMSHPCQYADACTGPGIAAPLTENGCSPPYPSSTAPDACTLEPLNACAARAMRQPFQYAEGISGALSSDCTPPYPS